MASIKRTQNGTYRVRISLGRDLNSKQCYHTFTASSRPEAKAMAYEYETNEKMRGMRSHEGMPFNTYSIKWLEDKTNLKESTRFSYEKFIVNHFNLFFGNKKMNAIKEDDIKDYLKKRKNENVTTSTVRKEMIIIREIFHECLKGRSPCRDIDLPKTSETDLYEVNDDEFWNLIDCIYGTDDELPILLAGICGLRIGEIFALKFSDVEDNTIKVRTNRVRIKKGYIDGDPKSKRGTRELIASDRIINLINKRKWTVKETRIFTVRPDSYTKRFQNIVNKINKSVNTKEYGTFKSGSCRFPIEYTITEKTKLIPNFRFHDLRHYHASVLYQEDIPDKYAAQRLGHDIMVMKRVYQHQQKKFEQQIDLKLTTALNKKRTSN